MFGLLNLGSLIFGLIAWVLPIINLVQRGKDRHGNWAAFSVASVSACAVSLCMQIFYGNHLVKIEDWSALADTSSAVVRVSTLLLVVTMILNVVTLVVHRGRK